MELFATYVHRFQIGDDDLVTQIIDHIYEQRRISEAQVLEGSCNNISGSYSVRGHGSFHSKDDLAQLDTDWSKKLRALLYQVSCDYWYHFTNATYSPVPDIDNVSIQCWGVILNKGAISQAHSHPCCKLAGTMWLQVPERIGNKGDGGQFHDEGTFCVVDPRPAAHMDIAVGGEVCRIVPHEKKGVVFPNWLQHYVNPHYGDEDRISIAWNTEWNLDWWEKQNGEKDLRPNNT
tara:strand:+ start:3261 stop:3959 length:699 start_codon:yes stop_codon:yes gene_type:complete